MVIKFHGIKIEQGKRMIKKKPSPAGRLYVQVVDHAFYAVLHQWHIPVEKESKFKIGKFKIS